MRTSLDFFSIRRWPIAITLLLLGIGVAVFVATSILAKVQSNYTTDISKYQESLPSYGVHRASLAAPFVVIATAIIIATDTTTTTATATYPASLSSQGMPITTTCRTLAPSVINLSTSDSIVPGQTMPQLGAYITRISSHSTPPQIRIPRDLADITAPPLSRVSDQITAYTLPTDVSHVSGLVGKWHVTTYWSCVTGAVQTHCGWHEPVLPGGNDISAAGSGKAALGALGVVAAAIVVGALLL
jgi:hypothetical protein